jgi:hypothetical protein
MSLNCGHRQAYFWSSRWYMSMKNRGGIFTKGQNSWFVHQSSLEILIESHQVTKQNELSKEINMIFRSIFVYTSKGSLTCLKISWYGADGFTPRSKAFCGFLSPLKIHRTRWRFRQRTSMLTITPPRHTTLYSQAHLDHENIGDTTLRNVVRTYKLRGASNNKTAIDGARAFHTSQLIDLHLNILCNVATWSCWISYRLYRAMRRGRIWARAILTALAKQLGVVFHEINVYKWTRYSRRH